jgi:hypothetical protein
MPGRSTTGTGKSDHSMVEYFSEIHCEGFTPEVLALLGADDLDAGRDEANALAELWQASEVEIATGAQRLQAHLV